MDIAIQDENVSSSISIIPDYFTQDRADLDADSHLKKQSDRKKEAKGSCFLPKIILLKMQEPKNDRLKQLNEHY